MTSTRSCKRCGATLQPGGSLQGLCPACLMGLGMAREAHRESAPPAGLEEPPDPVELAAALPAFEIEEIVGQGGMGVVYRARQKSLDRTVALKVLPASLTRDPSFHDRFAREARALASLNHPNIVGVYDFGRAGGHYFLAMEFVDGTDLRRLVRTEDVSPRQALTLVGQLCDALQYAHDQGVVHRDIKPENVLIDRQGRVKVSDFGLAKLVRGSERGSFANPTLTRADQIMGTPLYMAPEQVEHPLEVDHRADLYSLGVVFYELLTGELPLGRFAAPSMTRHGVDARLDPIVLRALEKEPPARYQQAGQMKTDVDRVASEPESPVSAASARTDDEGFVLAAGIGAAGAAVDEAAELGAGSRRGFFRKRGKDGDSTSIIGCGLGLLGFVILLVLVLGCLGALFLGRTASVVSVEPASPAPAPSRSSRASESVMNHVHTTPPGAAPATLDSDSPVLATKPGRALDWSSGTPLLADALASEAGIPGEIFWGAQSLVHDYRERYLALEAGYVHAIPTRSGATVVADAFPEARAELRAGFANDMETALGFQLAPALVQELGEQLFPLGQQPVTLELRYVDGVVHASSKQAPHLTEQGLRALQRFGHLLAPMYVAPPDAAAAVLALERELATLVTPPQTLQLGRVEAHSKFSGAGPVVEVTTTLNVGGGGDETLALWAVWSRELLERDWILETSFQGRFESAIDPVKPESGVRTLGPVNFVLRPEDARSPVPLEPIDPQQVQFQALDLILALNEVLGPMATKSTVGDGSPLRPATASLTGGELEHEPENLTTAAASLSSLAAQFRWQTIVFRWEGGAEPKLEFQLQRARP